MHRACGQSYIILYLDHYSTHADNIAVTHSIIDFQYIFLLLIDGACHSLLQLRTAYSQIRKCAYSNIASMGFVVS